MGRKAALPLNRAARRATTEGCYIGNLLEKVPLQMIAGACARDPCYRQRSCLACDDDETKKQRRSGNGEDTRAAGDPAGCSHEAAIATRHGALFL